jgi:tripartite-type tricarboxylate transporter receptor subunit TctC
VVCFGSFAVAPSPTLAEVWPERGVKIITSFPAGTGGDLSARLYAERLALRWGKSVIVENKPGADGILAVTAVIGMRDNHTLLYTNGGPVTTNAFSMIICPMTPCAISFRYPRAPMSRSRYRFRHH